MPEYIWTLVRRRNENYQFKDFYKMHIVCLAVILTVSTCRADNDLRSKRAMMLKEAEENIQQLRLAKERAEREEREKNSLAILADQMIKDSFESQLQSKMDILYDNHTDLTKELKFVPAIFNCGKEFDIFKLLDLAKAHRNITTEAPKCLEDLEDSSPCGPSNARPSAENNATISNTNNTGSMTPRSRMLKLTVVPTRNIPEVPAGVIVNPGVSTAIPQLRPADKKNEAKPLEKTQQKTKEKSLEAKHTPVAGVLDETSEIESDPLGLQASRSGISNYEINEQSRIIAKPAAALGSTQVANVRNEKATAEIVQSQEVHSDATQALEQDSGQQLLKGVNHERSVAQVQEQMQQGEKPETSVSKDYLLAKLAPAPVVQTVSQQKQVYQQVFTSALVTDQQQQATAATGDLVSDIPQQLLQTVKQAVVAHEQENQALKPTVNIGPEQTIQANMKPSLSIILAPQQQQAIKTAQQIPEQQNPQNVKQAVQTPERQNEILKILTQGSEQNQVLKPLGQGTEQQNQVLKPLSQASEQRQVFNPLTQATEQLNQPVKAPASLSDHSFVVIKPSSEQPQAMKSPQPMIEQQPLKQQSVREQQPLKPALIQEQHPPAANAVGSVAPGTVQQPAKPVVPIVQTPMQQYGEIVQQVVAKQMVTNSLKTQQNQLPIEEPDKAPVAAPVDVIIMDPFSNVNETSINKVELAPGNVPATAGIESIPNTAILHNCGTVQNVISLDKNMENKNLPVNLRNNPKLDYFYYQD